MKLSVIIVNYNVEHFLEQCLLSVRNATKNLKTEVFVVDNNSVDGSVSMVKEKFPEVILIDNKVNFGFSKANNQAIVQSNGEYILLLNPDTLVEEDTFEKIVAFMDSHPDAGGLGVKMVDGKGKFLPESKRGLPTPAVAFYKIFGLSFLFPNSKIFGKYHLGYLDNNNIHEIEILAGAFMLLRKDVLKKTGLLDESFFMYGEDIDLSWRIIKAGYKNYYFPETRIIHYKGESTKKGSLNYVFLFYNAMIIFAKKHFSDKNARTFSLLINFAIYFRAFISISRRFVKKAFNPLMDILIIYGGFYLIKDYWENKFHHASGAYYPPEYMQFVVPMYLCIWLISSFLSGGYDKPPRILKHIQGLLIGTGIILIVYSLLPESLRFSRALILLGTIMAIILTVSLRIFSNWVTTGYFFPKEILKKRFVIIGKTDEARRVSEILHNSQISPDFEGRISIDENDKDSLGNLSNLKDILQFYKINEVIFCARDISAHKIIDKMSELQGTEINFKIAPQESSFLIGSNSINTGGDIYLLNINAISKAKNKRNKRYLDIVASLSFLLISPVLVFLVENRSVFFSNIFRILIGCKSWVGYFKHESNARFKLPSIKLGVLHPLDIFKETPKDEETINNLNLIYARDYKIMNDINIILKGLKKLGRS